MENMGDRLRNTMEKHNWIGKYRELIGDAINDSDVQKFLRENGDEISEENVNRSAARIYEFVQEKNKIQSGESTFADGYNPKLILNNHNIEVAYEPSEATINQKKSNAKYNNFKLVNLPNSLREASIDDYIAHSGGGREESYNAALNFLEQFFNQDKGYVKGLYLSGDFGVGKTYLLAAIANKLVDKNVSVVLVHVPTFSVEIKSSIGDNSVLQKIDQLKKVPVLMLDDIGAETVSQWFRDEVLGVILQYRMQEKLTTFFSSNFSMDDLEGHLSQNNKGGDEPIKAHRIMERIRYLSQEVIVAGDNLRNQ